MKGDQAEGCWKIGYTSRNVAKHAAKKMARTHRGAGSLRPYKCSRCPYWHLGRGTGKKKWMRSREHGGAAPQNYGESTA